MSQTHPPATGSDPSLQRCFWCNGVPELGIYHDTEWGFPVDNDVRLFEKITLEGFQSGLSWRTILNKRENFRRAFAGFDVERIARFGDGDIERLLANAGIVRHRGKIEAAIHNAARACELIDKEGSLASYVWRFEPEVSSRPEKITRANIPSTSPASRALSKDLKQRGWKFVGPTTAYAFMQAMGLVNDHTEDCFARELATAARRGFEVP